MEVVFSAVDVGAVEVGFVLSVVLDWGSVVPSEDTGELVLPAVLG